jgi:hypothetical protein
MLDPQLKIKNVSGDGNCGFWAILRGLQLEREANPGQGIGNFEEIPRTFNVRNPSRADYQLMNRLRRATSKKAEESFVSETINGIRRHFANAYSLQPLFNGGGTEGESYMTLTIPPTIASQDFQFEEFNTFASAVDLLRKNIWRLHYFGLVDSNTGISLNRFRTEARNNFLNETDPARYQYLINMPSSDLWLVMTDIPYLVKVIGLPLVIIYPETDNSGHFTGGHGCFFYNSNGQNIPHDVLPNNRDPQQIANAIRGHYPRAIIIFYNGTNHYQVIRKYP